MYNKDMEGYMMKEWVVRLSSLKLCHIKNVVNGQIVMPNTLHKQLSYNNAEILGLYGQNGSGKTAIIDGLYFLQRIMIGESIEEELKDYIDANERDAAIVADFNVFLDDVIYEVSYKVELQKNEKGVEIVRETLSSAKNTANRRKNKTVFMDYKREDKEGIFAPKKRLDDLISLNKENKLELIVARKLAEKSNCSYIFGESSRDIFLYEYENEVRWEYALIIEALFEFAFKDLFVIRNDHSGCISANFVLPMAFRYENNDFGMKGDFVIPLTEPTIVTAESKKILDIIVGQINTVLPTIIPEMKIGVNDYGEQLRDDGEKGHKIELTSLRNGIPALPIRMESEGIIKIISILHALIHAFGNPSICLVIDELDAGIFEYMLGELLDIFDKSAKGQLIFTSHNLRALEMLDKDSIMFSTANPEKRYIHMKNIRRGLNNLRDVYIRGITLGGQDEVIYEETDSLKIARAFRKAGRSINNG